MIRKLSNYFVLLLITLNITSCQQHSSKISKEQDTIIGRTIHFSDSLLFWTDGQLQNIENFRNRIKGIYKIIYIIDGTCPKCIFETLNQTDSLFYKLGFTNEFERVTIVNSGNTSLRDVARELIPLIRIKTNILLDRNFNFEKENKLLSPNLADRCYLLNESDKIILSGNPLYYKKKQSDYLNWLVSRNR